MMKRYRHVTPAPTRSRLLRTRGRLREPARSSQIGHGEVSDATSSHAARALHLRRHMTITVGQLVSDLYSKYERELHDEQLAAVATEVRVTELLEGQPRRRARARKR